VKNIVLIDDEMTNFHCRSGSEHQVLRFCKVACYDDEYYDDYGLLLNMGGVGARNEQDYNTVTRFIESPWKYRVEENSVLCAELPRHIQELLEHVQTEEVIERKFTASFFTTSTRSLAAGSGEEDD